jgi:hypothetical protein
MCSYCNADDETPIHLFAECRYVRGVWGQIQDFFRCKVVLADLNPQSAILGWYNEKSFGILKNQILLIFKMTLYKDREVGIYSLDRLINKLKMVKSIEYGINRNNEYNRMKWEPISALVE